MASGDDRVTVVSIVSRTMACVAGSLPAAVLYLAVFVAGGSLADYLSNVGTPEYKIASGLTQIASSIGGLVGNYLLMEIMLEQQDFFIEPGSRRLVAFVGQGLLTTFGIVLGAALLLVPGIVFALRWTLTAPLLIGQGTGVVESIKESWRLTQGYGLRIFFAILLLGLLVLLPIGGGVALVGDGPDLVSIVLSNLGAEAFSVLMIGLAVALYGLLGSPARQVTDIFA